MSPKKCEECETRTGQVNMACFKIGYAWCGFHSLQALLTCFLLMCHAPRPVTSFSQGLQIQANFRIYCNRRASQRFPVHYDVATCNGLCEARRNTQNLLNIKVNASTYFRVGVEVLIEVDPTRGRNLNILGFAVIAVTDDDRIVGRFVEQREVLIASCDPLLEGTTAFHARPAVRRSSLKLVWQPGTRNYGRVHFRAWIVARHSEIYVLDSDYIHNELTGSKTIPVKDDFYLIMLKVFNISQSDITLSPTTNITALTDNTISRAAHTVFSSSRSSLRPVGAESVHVVSNNTADDSNDESIATSLVVSFADGRREELRIPTLDSFESSFERRLMTGFDLAVRDPFAHTKRDVPEFRDMFPEAPPPSSDSPLSAPFAPDPTNPFLQSFGGSASLMRSANPFQTNDRLRTGNGAASFSFVGQTPSEIAAVRFGNNPGFRGESLAFPAGANPFASQDVVSRSSSNGLSFSAGQLPFFPSSTPSFSGSSTGQLGFPDLQSMPSRQLVSPTFDQQGGFSQNGGVNQFTAEPFGQQQSLLQNGFSGQQQSLLQNGFSGQQQSLLQNGFSGQQQSLLQNGFSGQQQSLLQNGFSGQQQSLLQNGFSGQQQSLLQNGFSGQQQSFLQNGFSGRQQNFDLSWLGRQGLGEQQLSFPSQQSFGGGFRAQQSASALGPTAFFAGQGQTPGSPFGSGQQSSAFGQFSANPFSLFDFQQQSSSRFPTSSGLGFPNVFGSNSPFGGAASVPLLSLSNVGQGQFGSFFGASSGGSSNFGSLPLTSGFSGSSFSNIGQSQVSSFFGTSPVTNFASSPFASGFGASETRSAQIG